MTPEHWTDWSEDNVYPVEDWTLEVANGDTRLGYLDWVAQQRGTDQTDQAPGWLDLDALPLTSGDPAQALKVVWAVLDLLPDDTLTDDERDHLNTAMAWLKEATEDYPG